MDKELKDLLLAVDAYLEDLDDVDAVGLRIAIAKYLREHKGDS